MSSSDLCWSALIAMHELGGIEAVRAALHAQIGSLFALGGHEAVTPFMRSLKLWDGDRHTEGEMFIPPAVRVAAQTALRSWIQEELNWRKKIAVQGILDACAWHSLGSREQARHLDIARDMQNEAAAQFMHELGPLGIGYDGGITREV